MPRPTNEDIMRELGSMSTTLKAVAEQTKKTNGRVTKIEEWKNALIAVERYKKETAPAQQVNAPNATTVQVVQPQKWFQNEKLVAGVVAVLLAIAGVLGYVQGAAQ